MTMTVLMTLLIVLGGVAADHILMITLGGTSSHKVPFLALGEGLVARGHEVTLVSAFPPGHGRQGSVREVAPPALRQVVKRFADVDMLTAKLRGEPPFTIVDIITYTHKVCEVFVTTAEVTELLSRKFDLLALDGAFPDCMLGLVHHFRAPFIYVNTVAYYTVQLAIAGNPTMYSVTPFHDSRTSDRMTFWERSLSGVYHTLTLGVVTVINVFYIEPLLRQSFGSDLPSLNLMKRNVSLILQNGHHTLTYPRPFLPGVVEIGCIHCKKAQPLPQELEEFVTGGKKKGFIYVSFGTSVQSSKFPEQLRRLMVTVFGQLEYQVVWKFDDGNHTMTDLPSNVRLGRWLPQQDLLGHPQIKAFVNHGGLHSIFEAVFHGVPMVCMPVFCDHEANSHKAREDGYALVLELGSLTSTSLRAAINTVITDHRFKENVEHRSVLLRDQPSPPLERALYWVEYVLRHRGAYHLQGAARDLGLAEYFMLDTLAALVAALSLALLLLRAAWRKLFRKRRQRKIKSG